MADDISKKILIQVSLDEAVQAMSDLKDQAKELNLSIKAQKEALAAAKTAAAEYTAELAKGKADQQAVRTEIEKLRLTTLQANIATKQAKNNMVAAAGSYDEAQKKLTALGRAIKSAEGGFNSTNPVIQKQIDEYKALNTQLGNFDKQMGNHQRNVGNYASGLTGLNDILSKISPQLGQVGGMVNTVVSGFGTFAQAGQQAANGISASFGKMAQATNMGFAGFKQFGTAAKEVETEVGEAAVANTAAAETMGAVSVAGGIMAGVFAVIVAAIAVAISYLSEFQGATDKVDIAMAEFKGRVGSLGKTIVDALSADDSKPTAFDKFIRQAAEVVAWINPVTYAIMATKWAFDKLTDAAGKNAEAAEIAKKAYEDLTTTTENQIKVQQGQANKLRAQAKDKAAGTEAQIKLLQQADEKERAVIANQTKLGDAGIKLGIQMGNIYQKMNDSQIDALNKGDMALATSLWRRGVMSIEGYKVYKKAVDDKLTALNASTVLEERIKSQEGNLAARGAKEGDKYAEKQKALLLEIQKATDEANSIKAASIARGLQTQMDAFTKELSVTDEHYRQLAFKAQEQRAKMEAIRDNTKNSSKVRGVAAKSINAINSDVAQIEKEHQEEKLKVITEGNQKTRELAIKAKDELAAIQVEAMENSIKREIAQINAELNLKSDALDKEIKLTKENRDRLQNEIKTAKGKDLEALKTQLALQQSILQSDWERQNAMAETAFKKISDLKKKALEADIKNEDSADVSATGNGGDRANDEANHEALVKQLSDNYNIEISQENITVSEKLKIQEQYFAALNLLNQKYQAGNLQKALVYEKVVQDGVTKIAQNAINSAYEYRISSLEKSKTAELKNTSLTTTQKAFIEEKYRVLEGQAKVKEFKANQKLAIANALINLGVAEVKLWADPGFPAAIPLGIALAAESAAQIAIIASQKPPAYAHGGTFKSDGRGAVLPGYSRKDDTNATLRSGEAVIVSEAVRDPYTRSVLSNINTSFGGRSFDGATKWQMGNTDWPRPKFATGGVYSPTYDSGSRVSAPMMTDYHIDSLASKLGGEIAKLPVPNVSVAVQDINYQQGVRAKVENRATL